MIVISCAVVPGIKQCNETFYSRFGVFRSQVLKGDTLQ